MTITPPKALIFDMDSTLADTSVIWNSAKDRLFDAIGHKRTEEIEKHYTGMRSDDLTRVVHDLLKPESALRDLKAIMRDALRAAFKHYPSVEVPGAVAMVQRLSGRVPMAVASGSPLEGINITMEHLGLKSMFALVLSAEDMERGKPSPDVFLATASKLKVAPESCLVFEDSTVGARAAEAAGMLSVVRPNAHCEGVEKIANRVVSSWDEVTVESVFGED